MKASLPRTYSRQAGNQKGHLTIPGASLPPSPLSFAFVFVHHFVLTRLVSSSLCTIAPRRYHPPLSTRHLLLDNRDSMIVASSRAPYLRKGPPSQVCRIQRMCTHERAKDKRLGNRIGML